jgi:hypothetical protein
MPAERLCSVEGCDKPRIARGWCTKHYDAWRKHGDPLIPRIRKARGTCTYPNCGEPHTAKGYCDIHYSRLLRTGAVTATRNPPGTALDYLKQVVLPYNGDECLVWPFNKSGDYASLKVDGKNCYVMRIVCEHRHGPPPSPDHQVAHSCLRNPLCCTANHLRWATPVENESDKLQHGTVRAKLSVNDVLEIRSLEGALSIPELAGRFHVSKCTIWCILNRKTWKRI